jgi:hypothetical protein
MNKYLSSALKYLSKYNGGLSALSSIIFGAMAIVISVKSCQIAEVQMRLTELEYQPYIKVDSELLRDQTTGFYSKQIVTITNEGRHVSHVSISYASFFILELTPHAGQNAQTVIFPVVGYFDNSRHTNYSIGRLYTIDSEKDNNAKLYYLMSEARRLKFDEIYQFINLDLVNFVTVNYTNSLGEKRTQYFEVKTPDGGIEISKEELEEYKTKARSTISGLIDFDKVTIEDIASWIRDVSESNVEVPFAP